MKIQSIALIALIAFGIGYYSASQTIPITGNSILPTTVSGDGTTIQSFVCPADSCATQLISQIDSAKSSVHVMIYSFTLQEIADAMVRAKQRGLDVRVLADKTQAGINSEKVSYLKSNGVSVKIVDIPGYGIFHHKVTIVDAKTVALGSFNYSENANLRSAENLEIIEDLGVVKKLETEFQTWWSETN